MARDQRRSKSRSFSPPRKDRERDTHRYRQRHRSRSTSRERRDFYRSERQKKHLRTDRRRSPSGPRHSERRRSRSRSPRRINRSKSPDRTRRRRRSRSNSRSRNSKGGAVPKFLLHRPEITDKDLEGKTEEEQEMIKLMGFAGFDTSKGKHVPGNDVSAVHVIHKRKYRQYMNRKGGFNRPLDFVA